jgi:transposase-like protein
MPYSEAFKEQMVKRMLGPPAVSARALAQQVGVPQPTLSQWLRTALSEAAPAPAAADKPPPAPEAAAKRWTAPEKLRVLLAAQALEGEELGTLLRREGLHREQLEQWRQVAQSALAEAGGKLTASERRRASAAHKRVKELEQELRRKEKALAEAAALLILEKKLQELGWSPASEDDAPQELSEC